MMLPEDVADTIMNGVLRDEKHVFVPPSARMSRVIAL